MSSNTLGVRNSQNMHPFKLSLGGYLFLEHPTPQALPYILCWVTTRRVKSITKNSSLLDPGFMGDCPYSGNALHVGITVHIIPWTSGPTSIEKIIQSYFKKV
jgi:hypothetical protein